MTGLEFPRVINRDWWWGVEYADGRVDMSMAWGETEATAYAATRDARGAAIRSNDEWIEVAS